MWCGGSGGGGRVMIGNSNILNVVIHNLMAFDFFFSFFLWSRVWRCGVD